MDCLGIGSYSCRGNDNERCFIWRYIGIIIGIADAVDPSTLQMDYPEASGAVIGQHGFNLFWIGMVTFIAAFFCVEG